MAGEEETAENIDLLIAAALGSVLTDAVEIANRPAIRAAIRASSNEIELVSRLADIALTDSPAIELFSDTIHTSSTVGYGEATIEARNSITKPKPIVIDPPDGGWKPVKPQTAGEFMQSRGVVLPDLYYGELPAQARAFGFSIANISQVETLQAVRDSLRIALDSGLTYQEWRSFILKDGLLGQLPEWRLELIFRNNAMTAYHHGRHLMQYENIDRRPYGIIRVTEDDRTRPNHYKLKNFVARLDDEVWNQVSPPLGHNCRCKRLTLTESQLERYGGLTQDRDFRADDGWGTDPARDLLAGARQRVLDLVPKVDPQFIPALQRILAGP